MTAEPAYPLAHSALATAWSALGYDAKAAESAKRAFELSGDLSREERLSIEGQYRNTPSSRARAAEIYRTLYGFFPDNLDHALRLSSRPGCCRQPARTRWPRSTACASCRLRPATILEPRSGPSRGRRIAFRFPAATGRGGEGSAEKPPAQNARLTMLALARIHRGRRLSWGWAIPSKAIAAFEDGQRIYDAAGDRGGVASALSRIGSARWRRAASGRSPLTLSRTGARDLSRDLLSSRRRLLTANIIGIVAAAAGTPARGV